MRQIRIFISSPGDVTPEREAARRAIERLGREFPYHFRLEPIVWEREPLKATEHFQAGLPPPRDTDIAIVILWRRIGTILPIEDYKGALSGGPVTGTEWEFEDAAASAQHGDRPHLLVYRKTARAMVALDDDAALEEQRQQKKRVDEFFQRWFAGAEGTIRAAFHPFADEVEFSEKVYTHLRGILSQQLNIDAAGAMPPARRWTEGSPFRALESFELDHAPIFFGRSRAQVELREALASRADAGAAFLLVFGASGSGKSSLVKAGLLADLKTPGMFPRLGLCRHAIVRPSELAERGLIAGLAAALLAESALPELARNYDAAALAELLNRNRDAPRQLRVALRAGLAEVAAAARLTNFAEAKLALVIDQLEELFTNQTLSGEESARFIDVLAALAQTGEVFVIATMRSDFFSALESQPTLARMSEGAGRYLLTPPSAEELAQIIERPAAEAGLQFEVNALGISLADRIREEAKNRSALPLVEYLLDQLWQQRSDTGLLSWSAYERLEGLKGAIGVRAEQVLASLPEPVRNGLPRVIRSLVHLDADGTATARRVPLAEFSAHSSERALIDALLAPSARLLVAEAASDVEATVRLAHEALLTHWPVAKLVIEQDREFIVERDRVQQAAAIWHQKGEATDRLLPSRTKALAEAEELLKRRDELGAVTVRFIEHSRAAALEQERELLFQAQRRARRFRGLAAVAGLLAVVAVGGGIYAAILERQAEHQRQEAVAQRESAAKSEAVARTRLAQTLIAQARVLSKSAVEAAARGEGELSHLLLLALHREILAPNQIELDVSDILRALHSVLRQDRLVAALVGHTGAILHATTNNDGTGILTSSADWNARFWNFEGDQSSSFEAHQGPVRFAVFNNVEPFVIATASDDGTARIWDFTGKELAVLKGHTKPVVMVQFSPDGTRVVTASEDGTARVWDRAEGRELRVLRGHTGAVRSAMFDGGGERIVTAGADATARIWNAEDGLELAVLRGHTKPLISAIFSPDDARVVTASADETARLWDVDSGRELAVLVGHTRPILSAVFSPKGDRVVTAGEDATAKIWDEKGREIVTLRGHIDAVLSAEFSSDGREVVTASLDRTARIWDADSGRELFAFRGHRDAVRSAMFSGPGSRVLTASDDMSARLWDGAADRRKLLLKKHERPVRWALFTDSGRRVATGSGDSSVRVWEVDTGKELAVLRGNATESRPAAFTTDGTRLATVSDNGTARIWNGDSGELIATLSGHAEAVRTAAFRPDGRRIVTVSDDKTARIWDSTTGKELLVLTGHGKAVTSAVFIGDGQRILTSSLDWTMRIWDSESGRQLMILPAHIDGVIGVKISADQSRILSFGGDKFARVWDSVGGNLLATLIGHSDAIAAAAFSPDLRQVVTASQDGTARIWDAATGRELRVLRGHGSRVVSAVFGKDGRRIVTASTDGTVRVWDAANARELAVFEAPQKDILSAFAVAGGERVLIAAAEGTTVHLMDETFIGDLANALRYLEWRSYRELTDAERDAYNLPAPRQPDPRPTADDCDALAGYAFDPASQTRVESAVRNRWQRAVERCSREIAAKPNERRLRFQLGRALYMAGQQDEALAHMRTAAEAGYPAAILWFGLFHTWGAGMERDDAAAARLLQQAFDAGVAIAGFYLGYIYNGGLGVEADEKRALALWKQAADRGIPLAHHRLAERFQWEGDESDAASALFHYSMALKLYDEMGYASAASVMRTARANLARGTSVDKVLDAIVRVEAWRAQQGKLR